MQLFWLVLDMYFKCIKPWRTLRLLATSSRCHGLPWKYARKIFVDKRALCIDMEWGANPLFDSRRSPQQRK
jgi:hypothetical protein